MAGGWSRDGAVQEQIEDSVKDAVELARSLIPSGNGTDRCVDCDEKIPPKRREAIVAECWNTIGDLGAVHPSGNLDAELHARRRSEGGLPPQHPGPPRSLANRLRARAAESQQRRNRFLRPPPQMSRPDSTPTPRWPRSIR